MRALAGQYGETLAEVRVFAGDEIEDGTQAWPVELWSDDSANQM